MKKQLLFLGAVLSLACSTWAQNTCATAQIITVGNYSTGSINGTDVPNPVCASGGGGATAGEWYKYTPTQNYQVTVTTDLSSNPNVDNRVHVYTGNCGALVCLAGDDDSGSGQLCVVSFNVTANTDYFIAFDNRWTSTGFNFELIENAPPPPAPISFTSQVYPNIVGQYKYAIADMNGDYLDDIVSISSTSVNILYQQTDASFVQGTITTSAAQFLPTWSMAIADYNKDGFNDLMYGSGSGVSFFRSNSTGTAFTQQATTDYIFVQRSTFVDINNDGDLDAFACHDVAPNVYFLNDGNGNLSWNQGGFGDHPTGGHYATIWFDYDNDGDVDMFISKCSGGGQGEPARFNEFHRNNGDGTFTNVSTAANMNHGNQTWSSAANDFDNDGFMDVIVGVSNFQNNGTHLFMHNNGDGTFTDIAAGSGWDTYGGTSIEFVSFDFNNDGWADVFTNQGSQGRIFLNNGDNTFTNWAVTPNFGAVGDLNNDGFLDIQNGTTVFSNVPNDNNWIKMNLKGIESNINGIAARVEIHGAWGKQIRDVQSGVGFRHMSTLNPHFGIGQATAIDSVIIRWPSGKVDMICNPAINTTVYIEEGSGLAPIADFSASAAEVTSGEVVSFTDESTLCPNAWSWDVQPASGWIYSNGTTENSENPEIQFNDYGLYTITLITSNQNGESEQNPTAQVMVNSVVGLDEYLSSAIHVYPNPTSGQLNIEFAGNLDNARLAVVSTIGAELMNYAAVPNSIDVNTLSNGSYFLVIFLPNGERHTTLFVKK
jgi:PKD repeat protein